MAAAAPIAADAVQLVTARVVPAMRGQGLGRTLLQSAARGLLRRGCRAIEAFGDAAKTEPSCLVPEAFLVSVGSRRSGRTVTGRGCGWTCTPARR